MSSGPHHIHFKVKSSVPGSAPSSWSTVQWDGTNHITTLELKRHIAAQLGLSSSPTPFEFVVTNASSGEEYREDNFVVHKNTSVWVKKVMGTPERAELLKQKPTTGVTISSSAAGSGTGQAGQGSGAGSSGAAGSSGGNDSEDQQLLNFVTASSRARAVTPSAASSYAPQTYQRQSHGAGTPQYNPNAKPPPGYVCHRCQQPGHFIRNCPTNGDPAFDGRRPKAAIAVQQYENNAQKFFLRDVEDPKALARRDDRGGGGGGGGGAAAGGGGTVAVDESRTTGSSGSGRAASGSYSTRDSFVPSSRHYGDEDAAPAVRSSARGSANLICSIDHQVFEEPTVVSCCFATFCRRCIIDSLKTTPLCPTCKQPINAAEMRPNLGLQRRIAEEFGTAGAARGYGERSRSPVGGAQHRRSRSPARFERRAERSRSRERDRERDRYSDRGGHHDRAASPPSAYAPPPRSSDYYTVTPDSGYSTYVPTAPRRQDNGGGSVLYPPPYVPPRDHDDLRGGGGGSGAATYIGGRDVSGSVDRRYYAQ